MSGQGTEVRVISRILVASEWVVSSMHEGSSAATVRQLNQRAGIPINRIEAMTVTGGKADRNRLGVPVSGPIERIGRDRELSPEGENLGWAR
jgi:hypothetical protein